MDGYRVRVDDNFHFMDEDERYELGIYATAEEAIAACRSVIDRSLTDRYSAGMTEAQLWELYKAYGEYPFISGPPGTERVDFSAWNYAKERAKALCGPAEQRDD